MTAPRIGLYGPFGWGNLGDAAIQESMLHNVRERRPDARFLGISLNPTNTSEIHGIDSVPILRTWHPPAAGPPGGATGGPTTKSSPPPAPRPAPAPVRFLKSVLRPLRPLIDELRFCIGNVRILRELDLLVISGGGQISDDWGGPWDHPWSMFSWCACARIAGTPVAVVSVGAGPIDSPVSRRLFFAALRLASYRSVRDVESRDFLLENGCSLPVEVYPDLAFGHPLPPQTATGNDRVVVGMSPMSYCHPQPGVWPEQDAARYAHHMETLAGFTLSLMDDGHDVALFSNQVRSDRHAFEDVLEGLGGRVPADATPTRDLHQLLEQIAATDLVITSRLHGVILSFLQSKPVIALSYESKIDAVMRQFDQTEFRIDIDSVTPEQLRDAFATLESNYGDIRAHIHKVAGSHRDRLNQQYDQLFGPGGMV